MKKKVLVIIVAMVFILAIATTGFVYYEDILRKKELTETMNAENTDNSGTNDNGEGTTPELVINLGESSEKNGTNEVAKAENLSEEEEVPACCASVTVNMFDENGNIKSRDQFEEELNEYYENGKINSEDLEYYLFMYNESADSY